MRKIYGHPATSANRCFWLLEELELDYEAVPVDMRNRQHKSQEYLALNPNGKVPTYQDDHVTLFESMAINTYLAEKHQPTLLGTTLEDRALVHQWSFWSIAEFQKPMIDLLIQLVFVPEAQRDQSLMDKSREKIGPMNKILDEHLRTRTYMVGPQFSLADLHVASVARISNHVGIDLTPFSHLGRWLKTVTARPAYQKVEKQAKMR